MNKFLITIFMLFNMSVLFAQTCIHTPFQIDRQVDRLTNVSLSVACIAQREKYKCSDIEADMTAEEKKKIIQCDPKFIEENQLSKMGFGDCIWNGLKVSGEHLLDVAELPGKIAASIAQGFKETQICNASLDKKREILNAFNMTLDDPRFHLSEQFLGKWLEDATCAELEKLVAARYQNSQQAFLRERMAAINTGKKPIALKEAQKGSNLLQQMKEVFAAAEVKYECYTPKVKAEMICTTVTTLLADAAMGMGIKSAVTKISAMAKSKVALNKVSRALAADGKVSLKDAGKLTDSDRKKAAGLVVKRQLTEVQEKALIEAHEVGLKEGRGFFTYTEEDLLKKSRLLKEAGFSADERRLLMENGVTGTSGVKLVHGEKLRIKGEKLIGDGLTTGRREKMTEGLTDVKNYYKELQNLPDADFKKVFSADMEGIRGIKRGNEYGVSTKDAANTADRMIKAHGLDSTKTYQTMINDLSQDIKEYSAKSAKNYSDGQAYKAYRAQELKAELMERYYLAKYKNKFNDIDYDKMDRREEALLRAVRDDLATARQGATKKRWPGNE